jgi:hypothetical protein
LGAIYYQIIDLKQQTFFGFGVRSDRDAICYATQKVYALIRSADCAFRRILGWMVRSESELAKMIMSTAERSFGTASSRTENDEVVNISVTRYPAVIHRYVKVVKYDIPDDSVQSWR